jgi:NAD(P) transhydrogenase subunit beta
MPGYVVDAIYLVTSVLFIVGIKMLSTPASAMRGNFISAIAMALAVGTTLATGEIVEYTSIAIAIVIGTVIGIVASYIVKMTQMPQMVAVYNGVGGLASCLVGVVEFYRNYDHLYPYLTAMIALTVLVGAVTFTGSMVAFLKLEEKLISGQPTLFPMQHWLNLALIAGIVGLGTALAVNPAYVPMLWILVGVSFLLGVLVVIPIGGADMPVVIALLNSYSGIAASLAGFVLSNNLLIITGALVGASGIFLSDTMCRGMNRSIWNVLFGGFGYVPMAAGGGPAAAAGQAGAVKSYSIEDAVNVLSSAQSVIIVPGYGMAAGQAQHQVRDLAEVLDGMGVTVRYGIHPVAGRMPGHMNVLLAEANVPYDQLLEMDQINDDFKRTDVCIVVGANDVVNPAAHTDPSSPIYGMPVLNAEQAKTVMVLKRSMNPGFAGIENALFLHDNTMMLFGDARTTLTKLANALKRQ